MTRLLIVEQLLSRELIGRTAELADVYSAVRSAAGGRGGGVALVGEAGIGKSRLRLEAARYARELGVRVLPGRAPPSGHAEPFHPLREALTAGFRHGGWPDEAVVRPVLAALDPADRHQGSRLALAEALLRLLARTVRQQGALLVVEDLHRADGDTVAVVEYLVEHAADHGALCLLTLRADTSGEVYRAVRRLADGRALQLLEVGPLETTEVDQLTRSCLGQDAAPEELLQFVRQRADGIPFFVEELLAGLVRHGALVGFDDGWRVVAHRLRSTVPETLADSVTQRFAGLHPYTQQMLAAAALLGRQVDWRLVAHVTGLDEEAVLASIREAIYGQLLVEDGQEIRFRHALTREHVVALMLPPEREKLAARALATVVQAHPGLHGNWCELAAELAQLAGDDVAAVAHLMEASRRARQRGALGTAAARLERVLQLAPAGSAEELAGQEGLAQTRALAGDVDGALDMGRQALRARRARADAPHHEIDLELSLGHALLDAGRYGEALQYAGHTQGRAGELGRSRSWLQAAALTAQVDMAAGDPTAAALRADEVLAQTGDDLSEVRCEALEVRGQAERLYDVASAQRAFREALAVAEEHGLAVWRARALHGLGIIDLLETLGTEQLQAARRAAIETGAAATVAVVDFHLAEALVARGQAEAGRGAAQRAVALARRLGLSVQAPALVTVACSYACQRRRTEMEDALQRAAAAAPGDPAIEADGWGRARAMLALHEADPAGARAALDRAVVLLRHVPGHHFPYWGLWALLHAVVPSSRADAIRTEAAEADGCGARCNRAFLHAAYAVAAGDTSGVNKAIADLAVYQDSGWLMHLMRWLVAPTASFAGRGEPVSWLQAALRWFADHGYPPLATSCRTLLHDAGVQVPRRGRGESAVPDGLRARGVSSREIDVLRLLGRRLSNRGIAETLVLSPRTVEKHVATLLSWPTRCRPPDRASLTG